MSKWKETTLGEVSVVDWGNTSLTKSSYIPKGRFLAVSAAGMDGRIDHSEHKAGTTVLSAIGENCGFVMSPREDFTAIKNTITITAKPKLIDERFLYYILVKNKIPKRGAAQPFISKGDLERYQLLVPPLKEQKEIAGVLGSLDDKIELLREENKTLEATAQAIFREWFVNFNFPADSASRSDSGKPIAEGKPYQSSGGKMIDSELGKIPEGWRVGKIKNMVDILSGFAFSSSGFIRNGKYKLVTIKNVQDRYFVQNIKDTFDDLPSKMPQYCHLKTGDILLSLTGNVGRVCLVVGENYLLNQRVAKLQAINEKDSAFVYLLFLQESVFSLLQSTASGTAQQNLSPVQTKEIEIVVPPRYALDIFGNIANPIIGKINQNNSQIQTLSTLRDTLLPKLMSGEVITN